MFTPMKMTSNDFNQWSALLASVHVVIKMRQFAPNNRMNTDSSGCCYKGPDIER
jgi:hypothetical protein